MKLPNAEPLTFYNWKGERVVAPSDLPNVLANSHGGVLVLSTNGAAQAATQRRRYQVRYALQVKKFVNYAKAAEDFKNCLRHLLECEGYRDE